MALITSLRTQNSFIGRTVDAIRGPIKCDASAHTASQDSVKYNVKQIRMVAVADASIKRAAPDASEKTKKDEARSRAERRKEPWKGDPGAARGRH